MTMFLARIIAGGNSSARQFVHGIRDTEYQINEAESGDLLKERPRRKRAWSFAYGVAAISDSRHAAINAAKALVKQVR